VLIDEKHALLNDFHLAEQVCGQGLDD
jgi:hypothetical protein